MRRLTLVGSGSVRPMHVHICCQAEAAGMGGGGGGETLGYPTHDQPLPYLASMCDRYSLGGPGAQVTMSTQRRLQEH